MSKNSENETRDQYTVVLEGLRSDFKVFGESLDFVRVKVEKIDERLVRVELELEKIKIKLAEIESDLAEIKIRLVAAESDLAILKSVVAIIRHNQVTRDEFKLLESRVLQLENKISHKK